MVDLRKLTQAMGATNPAERPNMDDLWRILDAEPEYEHQGRDDE